MYRLTPKISMAAAIPANSAIVVAALLASSMSIARKVGRTPKRSRMSAAKPLPVTAPILPAISWTITKLGVIASIIQSIVYPYRAPATEYVEMPPESFPAEAAMMPGPITPSTASSGSRLFVSLTGVTRGLYAPEPGTLPSEPAA